MKYKENLLSSKENKEIVKVNIDDLLKDKNKNKKKKQKNNNKNKNKNQNQKHFEEVFDNMDMYDVLVEFMNIKRDLEEFGFMNTMQVKDFMKNLKNNFICYDTYEDNVTEENEEETYDLMPYEEKCLYER
jgi:hypothetical protein